ncbi:2-dehydro-3-deoxy-phosphogluconate aldolase [Paraoerskovia sediminicola]|uniref:2-dehydro-3-deoxy-phosphogluconate aldolase n=2 Tax=Paraoerskovia sediminicola TaxID=1138587 RepID=A0ABM8FZ21_9CELL|nr:2-dehydro-3-deoxy-phosphogluconate aldolase [Paraoerskovia sediminicola]
MSSLTKTRVVPVVVAGGAQQGLDLAAALVRGNLPVAELTLRVPGAVEAMSAIAEHFPDVLLGAGTVVRPDQVDEVVEAGARFIVSPGLSAAVVERAREREVPIIPGVATPSDIMLALELGLGTVKLFPAGTLGGAPTVKALSAPFPGLSFLPTGGVSAANMGDYLALDAVVAVGGSWMVDRALIQGERWDEIAERSREAVAVAARLTTGSEAGR